ncbi:MAG TPA: TA system VapC family ribonuclease toxin [Terracidiphilus sp.]|nr:TA system VapC family ribonuclease toxin [Terracidiphilus sp.]
MLDVNVLIALLEPGHNFYPMALRWFMSSGKDDWGICPLTEIGFVRITTNPSFFPGPRTRDEATYILEGLASRPGYRYWPLQDSWTALTAPFALRILGHQQVTDAYLLGMAIKEDGVLVTFDRGLKYLAGSQFSRNLLVLG